MAVKTPDAALWLIDALLSNGEAFPTTLFSVLAERRPGPLVDLCAKHKIKLPSGLYQHRANKLSPAHFRYLVAECRLALGNPRTFFASWARRKRSGHPDIRIEQAVRAIVGAQDFWLRCRGIRWCVSRSTRPGRQRARTQTA